MSYHSVDISIVVPCYNQARLLREALESVLSEVVPADIEVIVVDDGSSEDVLALEDLLEDLRNKFDEAEIVFVRHPHNRGLSAARNTGVWTARGRYILPLDADDKVGPGWIAAAYEALQEDASVAIAYPDQQDFGAVEATYPAPDSIVLDKLLRANQHCYSAMYRREVWEAHAYQESMFLGIEDWEFWLAAELAGFRSKRVPGYYLLYRVGDNPQSKRANAHFEYLAATLVLHQQDAYGPEETRRARLALANPAPGVRKLLKQRASEALFVSPLFLEMVELAEGTKSEEEEERRACVVTLQLDGISRAGGVGTASLLLARQLRRDGFTTTILWVGGEAFHPVEEASASLRAEGIRLAVLPEFEPSLDALAPSSMSYYVYRWLAEYDQAYDVVHFPDWGGLLYYSGMAKRAGVALQGTALIVGLHGPSRWSRVANDELLDNQEKFELEWMEGQALQLADAAWSPSQYMLEWVREELPISFGLNGCKVLPYPVETQPFQEERATLEAWELVFFGRLERRKGLGEFFAALRRLWRLHQSGSLGEFKVTLLGPEGTMDGQPALLWIQEQQAIPDSLPSIQVVTGASREEALSYIAREGRVAVIPSLVENSPNTIYECLLHGIPFVSSSAGGIVELVAAEDSGAVLAELDEEGSLFEVLRHTLAEGAVVPRWRKNLAGNRIRQAWSEFNRRVYLPHEMDAFYPPSLAVVVVSHDRPVLLEAALESVEKQVYPEKKLERILVDDASSDPGIAAVLEAAEGRGWKVIRSEHNVYLGSARNLGANTSDSEYILFLDDDDLLHNPEVLVRMARAAHFGKADIVVGCNDYFEGDGPPQRAQGRYLPLGPATGPGFFRNRYGGANGLWRRGAWIRAGEFSGARTGYEDWELYARAAIGRARFLVLPEPVLWYRYNAKSMSRQHRGLAARARKSAPYLDAMEHPWQVDILEISDGLAARAERQAEEIKRMRGQLSYYNSTFGFKVMIAAAQVLARARVRAQAKELIHDIARELAGVARGPFTAELALEAADVAFALELRALAEQLLSLAGEATARHGQADLAQEALVLRARYSRPEPKGTIRAIKGPSGQPRPRKRVRP